jgi:hypothetical protein
MSCRSDHDKGHDTDDGGFEELHYSRPGNEVDGTGKSMQNPNILYTVKSEKQIQSGVTRIVLDRDAL